MAEPIEADRGKSRGICDHDHRPRALGCWTCDANARGSCQQCDRIAVALAQARAEGEERGRRQERRACWEVAEARRLPGEAWHREAEFIRNAIAARGPMEPEPPCD